MEKVIIYLLIGVGYVIYNYYKKLNVPPKKPSVPENSNKGDYESYDPLEDLIKKYKKEETEPATDYESVEYENEGNDYAVSDEGKILNNEQNDTHKYKSTTPEVNKYSNIDLGEIDGDLTENELNDEISTYNYDDSSTKKKKSTINLEKAIVYQTIFNPKWKQ